MRTYHLFLDKDFCIYNVFESLVETRIIEPGINYIRIKENTILPQCIVIESIYKDEYLKSCLVTLLEDMGYDKQFQILKPLVREEAII
jgi:hypothetical protein